MSPYTGRYMKNNATGAIVPIIAYTQRPIPGEQVCYQASTRKVWVNVKRLKNEGEEGNRLNGYTLLPREYRPEGIDVA